MNLETLQFNLSASLLQFIYAMLVIIAVSYFLYLRRGGKSEFFLVYMLVGAVVFQFCHLLKTMPISIGFAFGLFALFSMIRFRSRLIDVRDLTYLFFTIGIAALDGLITDEPFYHILIWDLLIVGMLVTGEIVSSKNRKTSMLVTYEKTELLQEGNYKLLVEDLQQRLSLKNITKVIVKEVNFTKNNAEIMVFFRDESDSKNNS